MTWYEILLTVHIIAAMMWIGGAATGTLIGTVLRKSGDASGMAKFCTAFAQIAGPLFGGTAILVLISGTWMVALDGYPEFDAAFVTIGFVGWLISMVMGATVVGMSWTRIGRELSQEGATIAELDPLISRTTMLTWIDLAVRTAVVVVMVWQPV